MTTKAMDWLTAVVALGAILLLGSALIERLSGRTHPFSSGRPVAVDNWGELTSGGHRLGPADARVTIVEFGDYECPACRSAYPEIERALEKYGQDVTLVYRHWPLEYHSLALPAAVAAECAAEQGVFWEYHDRLYSSRGWLASAMGVTFSDLAEDVGVADLEGFQDCLSAPGPYPDIERDVSLAKVVGEGTPTVIINGYRLREFPDTVALFTLIDRELREVSPER